jgi:hypothetical protein
MLWMGVEMLEITGIIATTIALFKETIIFIAFPTSTTRWPTPLPAVAVVLHPKVVIGRQR